MNEGIVDMNQFQKIENEIKQDYFDLVESSKNINGELKKIFSEVLNTELSFLCSSYQKQLNELDKVNDKVNNYYSILSNVRIGYENQAFEISQNVNLYLNKLKEEVSE